MPEIKNRFDFVYLFDVTDGNPNGDPDAGNAPRIDPESGHGLVTDVAIKRRVRNYVEAAKEGADGYRIYIRDRAVLAQTKAEAYEALGVDAVDVPDEGEATEPDVEPSKVPKARGKNDGGPARGKKATDFDRVLQAQKWMCATYWDVRTFGAVMSSKGADCGQARGPVQLTFARSIDPVLTMDHTITRIAVETAEEAERQGGRNHTMGRKATIPYGLYRAHGFVTPSLAQKTGFSTDDLDLVWKALWDCWELDRSAARGMISARALIVFQHESALGNARAAELFDGVKVTRREPTKPARAWNDYLVSVDACPKGVSRITP